MSNQPVSAVAERDKLVVAELNRFHGAVARQVTIRNELVARLIPVTTSEPPQVSAKSKTETGVPLADEIAEIVESIINTNDILDELLSRLEI